jgi:hypothetical protein
LSIAARKKNKAKDGKGKSKNPDSHLKDQLILLRIENETRKRYFINRDARRFGKKKLSCEIIGQALWRCRICFLSGKRPVVAEVPAVVAYFSLN